MIPAVSGPGYYAEETTLKAPTLTKKTTTITDAPGSVKLYGRELRDYEDTDLENLLNKLSVEELEDLNNDFDPDNSLLPPSQRCKDQTSKEATGPYKREKLLKYLEESAKTEKDWEEPVPFTPGLKRGKTFETKEPENGKKPGEMAMPIELDLDDEDEFEVALNHAPERDLVDLAGILGMHNVLNQQQYYHAIKGKTQDETTGTTFDGIVRAYEPRIVPEEPENQTDVEECIRQLESDDSNLTEVNINNMKRVSKERIRNLIKSAKHSKHITKLSLANTAISDSEARELIELVENSTSLRVLNIESNYITPELLARIVRATLKTQSITEIKAENQRCSVLGYPIEMDIMMSVEDNDSLLRVGIGFQSMEARHRISEALERNYER
uniref:Tropomodulin n=1 Tax=Acrobeloides nanus TaxID=290746 RepID=A0A914EMD2_9BILA